MSPDVEDHEVGLEEIEKLEAAAREPFRWRDMEAWRRSFSFMCERRLFHPRYLVLAYRFLKFKMTHRRVTTSGFVFLPRHYEIVVGKAARMRIGRWVVIGRNNCIRCHEGEMYIGDKTVFGCDNTVNSYSGIYIGEQCLFADSIYIVDFDHNYWDPVMPVRSQGICIRPVRLEGNTWIGAKTTILRGVTVGWGSVIGAMSLVNKDVPRYSVVGGIPARVLIERPHQVDDAWRKE
ncbi:MAG: acyltransferase [Candidatus Geothermincolia bacterium]